MWLLLCILSTILGGLVSIALKKCTNENQKMLNINAYSIFMYHIFFMIFILFVNPHIFFKFKFINIIKILPLATLQTVGALCYYMSIKNTLVSTTALISKTRVLIPLILGVIILNEKLSVIQTIFSILLIIITIIVSYDTKNKKSKLKNDYKGIIYAYGFVLFSGIANFLNKVYINLYKNPLEIAFYIAVIIIFVIFLYCLYKRSFEMFNIKKINAKGYLFLAIFLDFASSLLNRFSLVDGTVTMVYVISSSAIIVTLLASKIFLKEKLTLKKSVLIFLGVFCVIMLAIFK